MRPVVLTPGEPAGIGPDLCLQLASRPHLCPMVAVADPDMLAARARQLGLDIQLHKHKPNSEPANGPGHLSVLPVPAPATIIAGRIDPANADYVLETIRVAVHGCLAGEFHALVTGPVHKGVINEAGTAFSGHTEYLAELCQVEQVVMMLAIPGLRVALATTHLPLREVCDAISASGLETTLRILHQSLLSRFNCPQPRILVCGLNPHAGEDGHMGREEIDIIIPLLEKLRREGMALEGPVPADTAFVPERLAQTDAVLAMYHDQGLPVLKSKGFGEAVNITLGLPIIRTSVDHGTALSLAGSGNASATSLESAIMIALEMQP
jgi:4-hydroxythreonine-4-phosphate dehydrogenase